MIYNGASGVGRRGLAGQNVAFGMSKAIVHCSNAPCLLSVVYRLPLLPLPLSLSLLLLLLLTHQPPLMPPQPSELSGGEQQRVYGQLTPIVLPRLYQC
jgi:hypothetical protein